MTDVTLHACVIDHQSIELAQISFHIVAFSMYIAHNCILILQLFFPLQGSDCLTCYTFNTHQAKHTFCKVCGVQSFYTPRSNPDGKGIIIHCLDQQTVNSVKITNFNGANWEQSMDKDPTIQDRSKAN